MTLALFLGRVAGWLTDSAIPYMISGSVGSVFHGEPRTTQDVDIVINPTRAQLERFLTAAAAEVYVSRESALDAFRERGMFNVVDSAAGWKADFVLMKDRPHSREEFERRRPALIGGQSVYVVSPEDSILSKLEWARISGSERQLRDVRGILRVQGESLDLGYLRRWAVDLEVADLLEKVLSSQSP